MRNLAKSVFGGRKINIKKNKVVAKIISFCKNLFSKIGSILKPVGKKLAPIGKFFKNLFGKIAKKLSFMKVVFNKKFGKIALVAIVAIYLVSAAVFAIGVYKYKWSGKSKHFAVNVYPFPAAYVGGSIIWYNDLERELEHAKFFNVKSNGGAIDDAEYRKNILSQMIDLKIWQIQARKNTVKIKRNDVNASYDKLIEQAGGKEKAQEMLAEFWDMNLTDLRNLIKDQLPKEKLTEKLQDSILVSVRAKHILIKDDENLAKEVAAKAKGGAKFEDLVNEYSQDVASKEQGGDLGFFNRGVMDADFEKAVFDMKVGDISDPVKTQFGYHIIKLEERKGTIDQSIDQWFSEISKKTKIIKFAGK
ncbi:MAG: peptidylprolyl isomerase [Patescibacteria group bacterium]